MATTARAASHLLLPPRARGTGKSGQDSIHQGLALAARIAKLAGIETVEMPGDAFPSPVEVYLRQPEAPHRVRLAPMLLCRIDHAGIEIHGLSDRDRHHLLSRRWGRLCGMTVHLDLPRNDEELEACWAVLIHAYGRLAETSPNSIPGRTTGWPGDLPKFSRTSLQ